MSDPKQTECSNLTETRWKDGCTIYAIMKTMYPPGYHHNGFVTTHALGYMTYGYTFLVPMNQTVLNKLSKEHCFHDNIYIMLILLL